jgi:hypothetical protein
MFFTARFSAQTTWFSLISLTPFNRQWLSTLRQFQFTVFKSERVVSEFSRLAVFFGFKDRIFRPTFKEVFERGLLISQALLQRGKT